jgi:hypothetical protein
VRKFAVAAAAILLLGAGAMIAIQLATGGPSRVRRGAPEAAPEPIPSEASAPPTAVRDLSRLPPGASPVEPPPPPLIQGPPRPEPAPDSWEAIAPAARPAALGPVGGALGRGLNELQPDLSACFDEVTQSRYGQQPFTKVRDYAPLDEHGTTVLMLQVETLQAQVRIVDAPVETRGPASDGLIACAQQVLRGKMVPAPQARPGARHRVRFALQQ